MVCPLVIRSSRSASHLDRSSLRATGPSLIGTALYGAVRRVVWDPGANYSRGPDSALLIGGRVVWIRQLRIATCRSRDQLRQHTGLPFP